MSGDMSLSDARTQLELSCEATRDLYIFMLGIVSPLTAIARERLESAKRKFAPTEEELNPNTKFADNKLAVMLDNDPDFVKIFKKKKFMWEQYDIFLKKVLTSITGKGYYAEYMASDDCSLAADCRLFTKIFEEEFVGNVDLEQILEDMSIYWNDDLGYALSLCRKTVLALGSGERWNLPPLYRSELGGDRSYDSDKLFIYKILRTAYTGFGGYCDRIAELTPKWNRDRICTTDLALIVCGMAEADTHPETSPKIIINEYVEIAKAYSTPESSGFVNGLLDKLINKHE